MDKRIQQALAILEKEIERDKLEIQNSKRKAIEEVATYDKSQMFIKKKVTIIDKIIKIFGYGKKR
jgi:hypothetical protein